MEHAKGSGRSRARRGRELPPQGHKKGVRMPTEAVKPEMYCDTCGGSIDIRGPEDWGWCRDGCPGITARIEVRQQAHYLNEKRNPCNLCGLSLRLAPAPCDEPHGLVGARVCGGYSSTPGNGSGALDDMTVYRFSLCEFCLDWLFSRFVVPVEVSDPREDVAGPPPELWSSAEERVRADVWRKGKESFFKEKARRDAARMAGLP